MNDQLVGKNLIKNLIVCAMAIMMIVGLTIPVAYEYTYLSYPVYETYTKTFNGFNTLTGNEYLGDYASGVAAVNWILLLTGIACFGLAVLTVFSKSKQQTGKLKSGIAITAFIASLLYMIEGIAMTALWYGGDSVTTYSPILFSIQLVLMVVYFILNRMDNSVGVSNNSQANMSYNQPQNVGPTASTPQANTSNSSSANEVDKYEELLKYKELLDMGAITQEEFDAKKKQLL